MRRDFEPTGPLTVVATMRSSDLEVTASEVAVATVEVTARRGGQEAVDATRVDLTGDRLVIEAPKSSGGVFRSNLSVHVRVEVPVGTSLDADNGSGDLRTRGPLARVKVRNGSGDIAVERAEDASLTSGSGDVVLDETGSASIHSGSGDIRLGRASARTELRSGSGDVLVESATDLSLVTGSGDGVIGAVAGVVSLGTGSGDLVVRRVEHGEIQAKTASGDVVVGVAPGTAALLDCRSISGRVTSDLEASDAPGESDLGVVLRLRSASGDVRVQRA